MKYAILVFEVVISEWEILYYFWARAEYINGNIEKIKS